MTRSQALFTKAQAFRSKLCFVPCWDLCGVWITAHLELGTFFPPNLWINDDKVLRFSHRTRQFVGICGSKHEAQLYIISYIIIQDHTINFSTHFANHCKSNLSTKKSQAPTAFITSASPQVRIWLTPDLPTNSYRATAAEDLNKCTVGNGARMLKSAGSAGPSA